ncbi:MAG: hypothetical protein ACM31H_06425 [Nitrososphaerales archaeon]
MGKENIPYNDRCPNCHENERMEKTVDKDTLANNYICNYCGHTILSGFGIIR